MIRNQQRKVTLLTLARSCMITLSLISGGIYGMNSAMARSLAADRYLLVRCMPGNEADIVGMAELFMARHQLSLTNTMDRTPWQITAANRDVFFQISKNLARSGHYIFALITRPPTFRRTDLEHDLVTSIRMITSCVIYHDTSNYNDASATELFDRTLQTYGFERR